MEATFEALLLKQEGERIRAEIDQIGTQDLPEGDVLVEVAWSSLNYKDGLAVTGQPGVVRGPYPFVGGIDLAGTVVASDSNAFAPGDRVIGTGWGLGERHWGGYSQYQRVRGEWLVRLPDGLDLRGSMVLGTAGLTAMLSIIALESQGLAVDQGPVLVTGASGGVGSLSVALLSRLGYQVAASTGRESSHAFLKSLGAETIVHRDELSAGPKRPLESARWAGAIDTVGGATLASILSSLRTHGSVAACGRAGDSNLNTTVFPFILRGVNLLGIDSNNCPHPLRETAWRRLAETVTTEMLEQIGAEINLGDVPEKAEDILKGKVRGRLVVRVRA